MWLRWLVVFVAAGMIFVEPCRVGRICPADPAVAQARARDRLRRFPALLFRALWADETQPVSARALVFGAVFASAYGVSDEWRQSFVPNRSCDALDWLADGIGVAAVWPAWPWLTRLFPRLK
jgi:hypothetical protein